VHGAVAGGCGECRETVGIFVVGEKLGEGR
jgi:hypothetical protein